MRFRRNKGDGQDREIIFVDPLKLNEIWEQCADPIREYVDPKALDDEHIADLNSLMEADAVFELPFVCWLSSGAPYIVDGRHRFAWLCAQGLQEIPITIRREEKTDWLKTGYARSATEEELADIHRNETDPEIQQNHINWLQKYLMPKIEERQR